MPKVKHEATAFFKLRGDADGGRSTRLKQALGSLDGVVRIEVNFILDVVSVDYDPDLLMLEDIKEKVDGSETTAEARRPHRSSKPPAARATKRAKRSVSEPVAGK